MSRLRAILGRSGGRIVTVLAAALVAVAVAAPLASGFGENKEMRGGARNPTGGSTREYRSETQIIANNTDFGTRQSNKGDGGGAIYGCRAKNGNEGCVEASNLADGQAFNFRFNGLLGGVISTDSATKDAAKPFTTNATGVATGLNADRVDGLHASQIVDAAAAKTKAGVVSTTGALSRARGVTASSRVGVGHYRLTFDSAVTTCVPQATAYGNAAGANAVIDDVAGQSNQLDVFTRTTSGTAADRRVAVTVTC